MNLIKKSQSRRLGELIIYTILLMYIVNNYGLGYYLLVLIIPYILFYSFKTRYNKFYLITISCLLTFGVIFSAINYSYEFIDFGLVITYVLFPVLIFSFGYSFSNGDLKYQKTYLYIFILIIIMNLFILITYLKTINIYGNLEQAKIVLNGRGLSDLWSGDIIKATEITVYLSFSLAILPTLFIKDNNVSKRMIIIYRLITVMGFISAIFISLKLDSRTAILLALLSFFTVFVYTQFSFKKIFTPLILILLLALLRVLYNINFFGVKVWWEATSIYLRFSTTGLESERFNAWKKIVNEMLNYPMGGRHIDINTNYAHNLWLDVIYDAGLISFLLILVLSIIGLISFVEFIYLGHPKYLKVLLLSIYTAFIVLFMTEPIMSGGEAFFFILFCFFVGITQGSNNRIKKARN